jgi:hypothetical protein
MAIAADRVQRKADQFADHLVGGFDWEQLLSLRTISKWSDIAYRLIKIIILANMLIINADFV